MSRRVEVLPRASQQIYDAALWWAHNRSAAEASRWLDRMESAIHGLADDAERFPLAPESSEFEFLLRQMSFGVSRRPTHRVLFSVHDERVLVYAVRHLARQNLTPDELEP